MEFSYLPFRRLQADTRTPDLVAGPLKLATKYQADSLRNRIVTHLETDWPMTLKEWDQVAYANEAEAEPDTNTSDESHPNSNHLLTQNFCSNPALYIKLARECNLPNILAIISYSLCCNSEARKEKLSYLDREDLEVLLLGKERMMNFICGEGVDELEVNYWVQVGDNDCDDMPCHTPVLKEWSFVLEDTMRDGDPLTTFRAGARKLRKIPGVVDNDDDYFDGGYRWKMCGMCRKRLAAGLDRVREILFAKLPSFFALERNNQEG